VLKPLAASRRPANQQVRELPVFPLGSVLFPHGSMSLKIFEPRYMEMAKAALKHQHPFAIHLIREGVEVGAPAVPETIGTLATIEEWDMPQLGILQVRVVGGLRCRIRETQVNANGLILAQAEMIDDDASRPSHALAVCATFLAKVFAAQGADVQQTDLPFDDAFWVGMRLTEMLPMVMPVKQKMLELTDATMRLEVIQRFLTDHKLVEP
jgi:uncharacterized protein